jgi:hypothetical protein
MQYALNAMPMNSGIERQFIGHNNLFALVHIFPFASSIPKG